MNCRVCKTEKPLADFCKRNDVPSGHSSECIACARVRTAGYRAANLEKVRAHDNARSKLPDRLETLRVQAAKYRAQKPTQARATWLVKAAIKSGRLVRGPCAVCGVLRAHGHHADYSKPYDVVWLCPKHHKQLHAGRIALA